MESLGVIALFHTKGSVHVACNHGQNGDSQSPGNRERNHFSWGNLYTSAECKTVITAELTVKSGMDPHMISRRYFGIGILITAGDRALVKGNDMGFGKLGESFLEVESELEIHLDN